MTENLIINGVDHAKFDLEWAKRGGVFVIKPKYMEINDETMRDYEFFYTFCAGKVICINDYRVVGLADGSTYVGIIDSINNDGYYEVRMATPSECAEEGVEYIEPPIRWRPIDTTIHEELRLLQFCLDNDTFPVKDQSGAYIMSKDNEFFSVSDSPRKSIELAFEYVKFKADNAMRGEK